jgi:hypothetical protein
LELLLVLCFSLEALLFFCLSSSSERNEKEENQRTPLLLLLLVHHPNHYNNLTSKTKMTRTKLQALIMFLSLNPKVSTSLMLSLSFSHSLTHSLTLSLRIGTKSQEIEKSETELLEESTVKYSQISSEELVIEKKLGAGSYGKVCLAKWNGALVAVKFCKNKGTTEEFLKEIKIMMYVIIDLIRDSILHSFNLFCH